MSPDERAEKLLKDLTGESTCLGVVLLNSEDPREHDPNRWRGRHTLGKSFQIIRDAIRAAVVMEREECAVACEHHRTLAGPDAGTVRVVHNSACVGCAAAVRSRS